MLKNSLVLASAVAIGCGGAAPTRPASSPRPVEPIVAGPIVPAPPPASLSIGQRNPSPVAVTLPARPNLAMPIAAPGFASLQELRVRREARFDQDVQVEGYVTWIYDCVAAQQAKTKLSRAAVVRSIRDDPTQCRRPTLHLGATRDEPAERGMWIVDVPRQPTAAERKNLPKRVIVEWPSVPAVKVGDRVIVRGRFTGLSPHGDANTDGLIVYAGLDHVAADAPSTVTAAGRASIVPIQRYVRPPVTAAAADPAPGQACADAVTRTDGAAAYAACGRAFEANPEPIYMLWAAEVVYRQYLLAPKADALAIVGKLLDQTISFDPSLWYAHYLHGRVERTLEHDAAAARDFAAAIHADPTQPNPYLALAVLYERWGYLDEALAVTVVALANQVADPHDVSKMAYQQAFIHLARGDLAAQAASLEAVLAAEPDNSEALFQRAVAAFDRGEYVAARRDFLRALEGKLDDNSRISAQRYLDEMAR